MPSNSSKAVLINTQVFIADNNIRRNVLTVGSNVQSADADIAERTTNVLPNGTYAYTSIANPSITIIRVSSPVTIDVTMDNQQFTLSVASLAILPDAIRSIVISNPSSSVVSQLHIIQA